MDLRTRYTALVTLITQYVKFASETLKRAEDEEVRDPSILAFCTYCGLCSNFQAAGTMCGLTSRMLVQLFRLLVACICFHQHINMFLPRLNIVHSDFIEQTNVFMFIYSSSALSSS